MTIAPTDIRAAYSRIAPYIRRTPLMAAASPAGQGCPISLKLEFPQRAGSFKPRGANADLAASASARRAALDRHTGAKGARDRVRQQTVIDTTGCLASSPHLAPPPWLR